MLPPAPRPIHSRPQQRARMRVRRLEVEARLAAATSSAEIARILVDEDGPAAGALHCALYLLTPGADQLCMAGSRGLMLRYLNPRNE